MYASLNYSSISGYTPQEVFDDIISVLTGTTNTSGLSTGLDASSSSITATVSAGWTLFNNVSPVRKVLRAPVTDDPLKYKYIGLELTLSSVYAYIKIIHYHTYTDESTKEQYYVYYSTGGAATTEEQLWICQHSTTISDVNTAIAKGATILVSASGAHIAMNSNFDNGNQFSAPHIATEHTRDSLWDTVANGYNPWVYTNHYGLNAYVLENGSYWDWAFAKPHVPVNETLDAITTSGGVGSTGTTYSWDHAHRIVTGVETGNGATPLSRQYLPNNVLDENKQWLMPMTSIGVIGSSLQGIGGNDPGYYGGDISSKCGIYLMPAQGSFNDIVVRGGDTYRIWPIPNTNVFYHTAIDTNGMYLAVKQQ